MFYKNILLLLLRRGGRRSSRKNRYPSLTREFIYLVNNTPVGGLLDGNVSFFLLTINFFSQICANTALCVQMYTHNVCSLYSKIASSSGQQHTEPLFYNAVYIK